MKYILILSLVLGTGTSFAQETGQPRVVGEKVNEAQVPKATRMRSDLTKEELKVLAIGETGTTPYILGGIFSIYPGFGIGHAVQGRFKEDGWKFLVGELLSVGVMVAGAVRCLGSAINVSSADCSGAGRTMMVIGYYGLLGFRIWGIVDAWAMPPSYNRQYRELKRELGEQAFSEPQLVFAMSNTGTPVLGLQLKF